jgi:fatty-acyl-CoA synthase
MDSHFANVWEAVADIAGEHDAVVQGSVRRTWSEYERRAAQFAGVLHDAGLRHDAKVALYLRNSPEYLEAHFAALKVRAVPVNVNYRYRDEELWYLLDNSDAEAVVFHRSLADRVRAVRHRLPKLKLVVAVDDGSEEGECGSFGVPYEALLAARGPEPRIPRSEEDLYILYTGGTTGLPKGVMQKVGPFTRMFFERGALQFNEGRPASLEEAEAVVSSLVERRRLPASLVCPPLIHGTGLYLGAMMPHCLGAKTVLLAKPSYDGHEVLETIERERTTYVVLVGDVMCKPVLRALRNDRERGRSYDLSSVEAVYSSGVTWSPHVKEELLEEIPNATLIDRAGSTEGGMGVQYSRRGEPIVAARFEPPPTTKVLTEDGQEVVPGSGQAGMVASCSPQVPIGYYKDPEKSAATFRNVNGVRYAFPGDWATVAKDGSLQLLGRGTQCINTGGEKVFPEEVEEVLSQIDGVDDCLVIGVPDEDYGQRVVALVAPAPGWSLDEKRIVDISKRSLAGYKAPKRVVTVERMPRFENGKPDYARAKDIATSEVVHAAPRRPAGAHPQAGDWPA